MAGHHLEEDELKGIVEQTFLEVDSNCDGLIDFEEFSTVTRF